MESKVHELIKQFLINDNKAIGYYENNKIGFDHMLVMKKENAENIKMLLEELNKISFWFEEESELLEANDEHLTST